MSHQGEEGEFLLRMRDYMPTNQRDMLTWVTLAPSLRSALLRCQDHDLRSAYNKCLDTLAVFRTQHLILASRYITSQVKRLGKLKIEIEFIYRQTQKKIKLNI